MATQLQKICSTQTPTVGAVPDFAGVIVDFAVVPPKPDAEADISDEASFGPLGEVDKFPHPS